MSGWEAGDPGTTKAWWVAREGCLPKGHHERWNEFKHLLHEYNLNPLPANLADLEVCVGHLIEELGGRRKPVVTSAVGQFAYKKVKKFQMGRRGEAAHGPVVVPQVAPVDTSAPGAKLRIARHVAGEVLGKPEIQSDRRFKRDTENLETGLFNLLLKLGGGLPPPPAPGIPAPYDV